MAKKAAPGSTAKHLSVTETHTIKVGQTATAVVDGHGARTESPEFVKARTTTHKILEENAENFYGDGPIQAHHGGSIWVFDDKIKKWRMFQNLAGIEWSGQFACDPKKVDVLRQNAKALVDAFPATIENLKRIGYTEAEEILNTPIVDGDGIGRFVDSLFNACVPLPQPVHTGAISEKSDRSAGRHSYPAPNTDIVFLCRDDFHPFIWDRKAKSTVHVAPVAHAGSPDKRVRVIGAHPGHPLHKKHQMAEAKDKALVLAAHDPISLAAWAPAVAEVAGTTPAPGTSETKG